MIPTSTTTITVLRSPVAGDYDEPYSGSTPADRTPVYAGVRAVIDRGTGSQRIAGGEQEVVDALLVCDPTPLSYRDQIRDDNTGDVYDIVWTIAYAPSHNEAGLRLVRGVV